MVYQQSPFRYSTSFNVIGMAGGWQIHLHTDAAGSTVTPEEAQPGDARLEDVNGDRVSLTMTKVSAASVRRSHCR